MICVILKDAARLRSGRWQNGGRDGNGVQQVVVRCGNVQEDVEKNYENQSE
jgi:hypothetical protein